MGGSGSPLPSISFFEAWFGRDGPGGGARLCGPQHPINTLIPGTTDTEFVRRAAGMMNAPDAVWEAAVSVWAKSNVAVANRLAHPPPR
jgi:hypothetical protein